MNTITLVGRIASDFRTRATSTGKQILRFDVAVKRSYGKDTDFIPCVAWELQADFIDRYFRKGKWIAVTGELQQSKYTDKETGKKLTSYEVNVKSVSFAGDNESAPRTKPAEAPKTGGFDRFDGFTDMGKVDENDGDLPF